MNETFWMQQLAIAVDINDYNELRNMFTHVRPAETFADFLGSATQYNELTTPDNTYVILYWEEPCLEQAVYDALLCKLSSRKHALIAITEEGDIVRHIASVDADGCSDGEFEEILGAYTTICLWGDADAPLPSTDGMDPYVVCMDEYYLRDAQMFDTEDMSDEELNDIDLYDIEHENCWHDTSVRPYVGTFWADSEEQACQIAADEKRYDKRVLYAEKIDIKGGPAS